MNILVPLPIVCLMLVTWGLLCYGIGAARMNNMLVDWMQRLDANLRLLYSSVGFAFPDETQPEQRRPWWRRLWAWGSDRMEPTLEVEAVEDGDEKDADPAEPFVVDPNPATNPIPRLPAPTGPATVPSTVVIADDWAAKSARMLAEWEAASAEIGRRP